MSHVIDHPPGFPLNENDLVTYRDDLEIAFTERGVTYRLGGRLTGHGAELTHVEIEAPRALTVEDLRAPLISTFTTNFGLTEGEIRSLPIRRGRPRDPSSAIHRLDEVARIARAAEYGERGQAVADWFSISHGYARQLISKAAAAGFETWR